MRIVVHDYGGYPFTVQLSRALADRGHEVVHLHGGGVRASRAATSRRRTDAETLRIEPVALHEPLIGRAGLARLRQERRYGDVLARQILSHHPEVVLSAPSSLDAQASALIATQAIGAGFVYWLQDLYGEALGRLLGRRSRLLGRLVAARFGRLERRLLRESDAVVAITHDFRPQLDAWSVASSKLAVIPNWAPLDELRPMTKSNPWAVEHSLADAPVFLYAGTLGRKHDPRLLSWLAEGVPEAKVVVVAEGAGADALRADTTPDNLLILPLQPAERLSEVLASADVLVALLDRDANVFSVPSKVLTYLAASRPILAAIPAANLAARTINDAGGGVVVEPDDVQGFVHAARALLSNGAARREAGERGREYASRAFDIGPIADRFESVLQQSRVHTARA